MLPTTLPAGFTPSKTLSKALARTLGEKAVLSYQDGTKLPGQFIVVGVPTNTPIGQVERRYKDIVGGPDILEYINGFREIMYSVQVYREEEGKLAPNDQAELVRLYLQSSEGREEMMNYGLAFSRISEVRDLTQAVDSVQERRFQLDVFYNTVQTLEQIILSIESIDIIAVYQGAFATETQTIEVRKP